jgi:ABC-type glycerol-3-phosphate transport system permease component
MKRKKSNKDVSSILLSRTKAEKVLYAIVFVLFSLYALSMIFSVSYLIKNSFMEMLEYNRMQNPFDLPKEWQTKNYIKALTSMSIPDSNGNEIGLVIMFFNSVFYCVIRMVSAVLMSSFTGYVMAKYKFKASGIIYTLAIFSMTMPVIGTSGSMFKLTTSLGIYNNPFFTIVTALGGFGFNFLVMYGVFKGISWNYAEAVFIDGGNHFTAFFKIMLPQAFMPMLTLCIMSFIGDWNDYMTVLMYLPDYPTLSTGLYSISKSIKRSGDYPTYFAGLVVATIPILVIFASCSGMIMKNFSIGGLKG